MTSISGRLVYSPEIRFTPSGETVLSFEMDVSERHIFCEAQGQMAEDYGMTVFYPEAGDVVSVSGFPVSRRWRDFEGKSHVKTVLRLTSLAYYDDHGNVHEFGDS